MIDTLTSTSVPDPVMCHDEVMDGYQTPKLDGNRVVLKVRVAPAIHRAAIERAEELDRASSARVSAADYVAHLIARDTGLPSPLDRPDPSQEHLPLDRTA